MRRVLAATLTSWISGHDVVGCGDTIPTTAPPDTAAPGTTAQPMSAPRPLHQRRAQRRVPRQKRGPIEIGNIGDYSGPIGASNASWPKGVDLWVKAINAAGGICGRQVEQSVTDAAGDTAAKASAAQSTVETKGVVAMVGNANSLSGSGSLDYLLTAAIPVVGPRHVRCLVPHPLGGADQRLLRCSSRCLQPGDDARRRR